MRLGCISQVRTTLMDVIEFALKMEPRMPMKKLVGSFVLMLGSVAGLAQQPAQDAGGGGGPIRLNVVVTAGAKGKPVEGLAQSSFTVFDNGAPQPIRSFRAVTGQSDPVKV